MVQGYIYILPSLFFMVCFCLLPIFMSTYFSFTDYDIMTKADFVGVDNYSKIFSDKYIIDALKNTFVYVIVTVPIQTFLALVFAAFLADRMHHLRQLGVHTRPLARRHNNCRFHYPSSSIVYFTQTRPLKKA